MIAEAHMTELRSLCPDAKQAQEGGATIRAAPQPEAARGLHAC
jgi:hypothetical protein